MLILWHADNWTGDASTTERHKRSICGLSGPLARRDARYSIEEVGVSDRNRVGRPLSSICFQSILDSWVQLQGTENRMHCGAIFSGSAGFLGVEMSTGRVERSAV